MVDLECIEKYLKKAGFEKDPVNHGNGYCHFKYYKRCGVVWVMKNYDDDDIYIGCLL